MRDVAHQESFHEGRFHSPLDADEQRAFSGYASCEAIPALWDWLDAGWLASLEGALAARPPAVDDVRVWICGEDDLVAEDEHDAAVRALGAEWPVERRRPGVISPTWTTLAPGWARSRPWASDAHPPIGRAPEAPSDRAAPWRRLRT